MLSSFIEKKKKEAANAATLTQYQNSDPMYLAEKIESMALLEKERKTLTKLVGNQTVPCSDAFERRYRLITSDENRIFFKENERLSQEGIEESLLSLAHPVEIDSSDLHRLLMHIEEVGGQRPQLLLTLFDLKRKTIETGGEVFSLDMELLKREFR